MENNNSISMIDCDQRNSREQYNSERIKSVHVPLLVDDLKCIHVLYSLSFTWNIESVLCIIIWNHEWCHNTITPGILIKTDAYFFWRLRNLSEFGHYPTGNDIPLHGYLSRSWGIWVNLVITQRVKISRCMNIFLEVEEFEWIWSLPNG